MNLAITSNILCLHDQLVSEVQMFCHSR